MTRRPTAAISVPCVSGLLALALAGCGGGSSAATGPATGSITCQNITGTADFSPPLTLSGSATDTTTITLTSTECTTSGSDVTKVVSGTATVHNTSGSSSCVALLNSRPLTATVNWDPDTIEPSVVSFSGYSPTEAGGTGFLFPGTGHSAKVTGSFAGANHGADSSASAFTTESTTQILGECSGPGLASIPISSGVLKLG
jgi:hypothetical protein